MTKKRVVEIKCPICGEVIAAIDLNTGRFSRSRMHCGGYEISIEIENVCSAFGGGH